jgi:hypothetical protein
MMLDTLDTPNDDEVKEELLGNTVWVTVTVTTEQTLDTTAVAAPGRFVKPITTSKPTTECN